MKITLTLQNFMFCVNFKKVIAPDKTLFFNQKVLMGFFYLFMKTYVVGTY